MFSSSFELTSTCIPCNILSYRKLIVTIFRSISTQIQVTVNDDIKGHLPHPSNAQRNSEFFHTCFSSSKNHCSPVTTRPAPPSPTVNSISSPRYFPAVILIARWRRSARLYPLSGPPLLYYPIQFVHGGRLYLSSRTLPRSWARLDKSR